VELFNKLTISHFIWYLVPGLALVFFLLFPFFVLNPPLAKLIYANLTPVGIVMLAIFLGFVLDGLRLYRMRPKYKQTKIVFFTQLKNTLGANNLDPYFVQSHVADVARQKDVSGIGIHHAIWIMHGHLSILAFLECLFWVSVLGYFYFFGCSPYPILVITTSWTKAAFVYGALSLVYLSLGLRFHKISMEDQSTTNKMFLNFATQHRKEIKHLLNIP
jgi:hypothetical protein